MLPQDMVCVTCHFPSYRAPVSLDLSALHRPTSLRSHIPCSSYCEGSRLT